MNSNCPMCGAAQDPGRGYGYYICGSVLLSEVHDSAEVEPGVSCLMARLAKVNGLLDEIVGCMKSDSVALRALSELNEILSRRPSSGGA